MYKIILEIEQLENGIDIRYNSEQKDPKGLETTLGKMVFSIVCETVNDIFNKQ